MAKFKKGDRVRVIEGAQMAKSGLTGTVLDPEWGKHHREESMLPNNVTIERDDGIKNYAGDWRVPEHELELIERVDESMATFREIVEKWSKKPYEKI